MTADRAPLGTVLNPHPSAHRVRGLGCVVPSQVLAPAWALLPGVGLKAEETIIYLILDVCCYLFRTTRLAWQPAGLVPLKGDHLKVQDLIVINLLLGPHLKTGLLFERQGIKPPFHHWD